MFSCLALICLDQNQKAQSSHYKNNKFRFYIHLVGYCDLFI